MKERIVYSSGKGRICPSADGRPRTATAPAALPGPQETVPEKITATLNLENAGPGKKVTVVHGLPKNAAFLESSGKGTEEVLRRRRKGRRGLRRAAGRPARAPPRPPREERLDDQGMISNAGPGTLRP